MTKAQRVQSSIKKIIPGATAHYYGSKGFDSKGNELKKGWYFKVNGVSPETVRGNWFSNSAVNALELIKNKGIK